MVATLDHVIWAVADLDVGRRRFAELAGVEAAAGGTHPGFGTRNAVVGLGEGVYLEILALDPAQGGRGAWADGIAGLLKPRLTTFAARTGDLAAVRRAAEAVGVAMGPEIAMERTRPDGVRLAWTILMPEDDRGGRVPFLIDWRGSPHPSATAPGGCRLVGFSARDPEPERLAAIYAALGLASVPVERGAPGLTLTLDTPRGRVVLES